MEEDASGAKKKKKRRRSQTDAFKVEGGGVAGEEGRWAGLDKELVRQIAHIC